MSVDYVGQLRHNGELMAAAAERDLDALDSHVPTCPEWNVGKLVIHTGIHHRWVASAVRGGGEPPDNPSKPGRRGSELIAWFRDGWHELAELLEASEDETPAWSWSGDNRVGFWRRRTSLETLVHRWDAENATGETSPLDAHLSADGIDEMLFVMLPDGDTTYEGEAEGSVTLAPTDAAGVWRLDLQTGRPVVAMRADTTDGDSTLSAPASDLLLFLWGRLGPGILDPSGDEALVASFTTWVQA